MFHRHANAEEGARFVEKGTVTRLHDPECNTTMPYMMDSRSRFRKSLSISFASAFTISTSFFTCTPVDQVPFFLPGADILFCYFYIYFRSPSWSPLSGQSYSEQHRLLLHTLLSRNARSQRSIRLLSRRPNSGITLPPGFSRLFRSRQAHPM